VKTTCHAYQFNALENPTENLHHQGTPSTFPAQVLSWWSIPEHPQKNNFYKSTQAPKLASELSSHGKRFFCFKNWQYVSEKDKIGEGQVLNCSVAFENEFSAYRWDFRSIVVGCLAVLPASFCHTSQFRPAVAQARRLRILSYTVLIQHKVSHSFIDRSEVFEHTFVFIHYTS